MTTTIELRDPQFAEMFQKNPEPCLSDLPGMLPVGRTKDGQTRAEFEAARNGDGEEFADREIWKLLQFTTLEDLQGYLEEHGNQARLEYLKILKVQTIFEQMLARANGDTEANLWELIRAHASEEGVDLPENVIG